MPRATVRGSAATLGGPHRRPAARPPSISVSGLSPTIQPSKLSRVPHIEAATSKRAHAGFLAPISSETQIPSNSDVSLVAASLARWMSPAPFVAIPRVHPAPRSSLRLSQTLG